MIGKISGGYAPDSLNKSKARKGYSAGDSYESSDSADFSSFSVELARINGELKNVPDVRQDIVDKLKKQVEAGEYHPPLDALARNLYIAGILDVE